MNEEAKRQSKAAVIAALLTSRPFCWITKPFDYTERKEPKVFYIDSTGLQHRFRNSS